MKKGFLLFSILLVINLLQLANASNSGEKYTPRQQEAPSSEAYLYAIRSNQMTGKIKSSDVALAAQQVQAMNSSRNQTALNWHSLGPDNYGGKTKGLIYDNRDATYQTLLAGAVGGGIWKSTNDGITWQPLGTPNLMVSSMVQAANGDIYVGTGDGFNAHLLGLLSDLGYSSGFMGQGIWKSTDGVTFSVLTATVPQSNNNESDWAFINELALNSEGHIFAATNSGLKYSTDGGLTWNLAKDNDGNPLSSNAGDIQAGSDGTLLAAVESKGYISRSGNPEDFELISTGEENALPADEVTRLEFAIAPSNPDVMYAAAVTSFGVQLGIYRSGDKGETWQVILPATISVNIYNGRGNYNNHIVVFPNDPDRIIIGGLNLWQGKKVVEGGLFAWDAKSFPAGDGFLDYYVHFGQQRLIFKPGTTNKIAISTDGGVHKGTINGDDYIYTVNNRNYITSQFYKIAPSGGENRVLGSAHDQGTIFISGEGNTVRQGETIYAFLSSGGPAVVSTINPDAIVVTGTAGSMDRSEDMAFTLSTQFLLSVGMGNTQAYQTPVALWESYEDYNSRDSVTFKSRGFYQGGQVIKAKSQNFDHPFYYTLPSDINLNQGDSLRIKDIVSSKLFIAVANKIWMTKNFLDFTKRPDWFEISNVSVGLSGIPQSIAYSADGNHLFVGMRDGKLFRISNLSLAYNYERADVNSPQCIVATRQLSVNLPNSSTPISQAITSIAVDPNNPNNVLLTLGNYGNDHYVYMTTNALDADPTFVSKQGNLPKMPVYSSIFEMSTPGYVMLGTEYGIFTTGSITGTPDWTSDLGQLSNVPVFDLKQQIINKSSDTVQLINVDTLVKTYPGTNNYGIIYGATFGRGLFRCNDFRKPVGIDEPILPQANNFEIGIFPNPVVNQSIIDFILPKDGNVHYSIFDLQGRMIQSEIIGYRTAGKNQVTISGTELTTGTYILRLESGNQVKAIKFLVY